MFRRRGRILKQIFGWVLVAVETPCHAERVSFPSNWHFLDGAVARVTTDAASNVNAVIKVDEIGDGVDFVPPEGLVAFKAVANRRQHWGVCPNLAVAAHADFGRWHRGIGLIFDGGVAIAAVDP